MPTLLTHRRMDPALAARIEASLRRSSGRAERTPNRPRTLAIARLAAACVVVAVVVALRVAGARANDRVERRREALVEAVQAASAGVRFEDFETLARAEASVRDLAGAWSGDLVSTELRARGGLDAVLAWDAAYVRAPLADVAPPRARSIAAITREATKDALLLCLRDPPASREAATMVAKAREARDPARLDAKTASIVLLRDAEAALPLLAPTWLARVQAAPPSALARLDATFAHAPVATAMRAVRARFLLVALDEESSALAIDADRAHDVRVALFDLATGAPLLRLRRRVDPARIAPSRRASDSFDLDACALALDVREAAGATLAGAR